MAVKNTVIGDREKLIQEKSVMDERMDKLKDISEMSYEELGTYVDNNVTDLPTAKVYLKKLSNVVLAMDKLLMKIIYNIEEN